jgi:hypothetical protein
MAELQRPSISWSRSLAAGRIHSVEALGIPLVSFVPTIWLLPMPGFPVSPGFAPRGPIG